MGKTARGLYAAGVLGVDGRQNAVSQLCCQTIWLENPNRIPCDKLIGLCDQPNSFPVFAK